MMAVGVALGVALDVDVGVGVGVVVRSAVPVVEARSVVVRDRVAVHDQVVDAPTASDVEPPAGTH